MQTYISEQLLKNMCNVSQELAIKVVRECGLKYGFDGESAIRELGLETVEILRKKVEKSVKEVKNKVVIEKASFALPFNGECNDSCCQALRQNNGLYTQCQLARKGANNLYCKSCQQLAEKSEDGVPEYGTITQRMSVGIFEYVDPKGRKPVSYTKVMKKYKLTEEQVLAEAGRLNITINTGHFEAPIQETKRGRPASPKVAKEPKGSKGRPKKAKKVLEIEGDEDDLFASLVADATQEEEEKEVEVEKVDTKALEKEAQRLKKEEQRLQEKAEKEAKLAAEKAEKEAKLAAKELEKKQKEEQRLKEKAEKEAKLAADKAEKEAKLAADKAEKEAKVAAEKAEKEASKKKEGTKKKKEPVEATVEDDEEPDVVKKIEFEGKKYLKSKKTGIIYDYTEYVKNGEQVVVGKWNESKNKIEFTETSEESEEEYEE